MTAGTSTSKLPAPEKDAHDGYPEAIARDDQKPVPEKEMQPAGGDVAKAVTGVFPVPATDSPAAETFKLSKRTTNIVSDTNHSAKVSGGLSDTAKAEARNSASSESTNIESGKGSQPSEDGKSDQAGKHEANAAAPQGSSTGSKESQHANASGFANLVAAQTSGTNNLVKETNASVLPMGNVAQAQDIASRPASKPTEIATAEQLPVESTPLSAVQAAKLIERAGQSELHVGFQAGEFGSVDIRTSMVHNQISAEISVEHSGLRNLLAVELPRLEERLATHQVGGANISLNSQSGGGSAHSGQAHRQNASAQPGLSARPVEAEATGGNVSVAESHGTSAQIDIHM